MVNSRFSDINEGIKNIIKNALLECVELEYIDLDTYNEAVECFAAQWWYFEEYNKVYLYYELDDNMRYTYDSEKVFGTINKNIMNTFPKALSSHCEILGAPSNWFLLEKKDKLGSDVFYSEDITAFTITWWTDWNGNRTFINDKHIVKLQLTSFNSENERRSTFANHEYLELLTEIRNRYIDIRKNDPDNYDIADYWREYADLYYDRFGITLRSVDEYGAVITNGGAHPIIFEVVYEEDEDDAVNLEDDE